MNPNIYSDYRKTNVEGFYHVAVLLDGRRDRIIRFKPGEIQTSSGSFTIAQIDRIIQCETIKDVQEALKISK